MGAGQLREFALDRRLIILLPKSRKIIHVIFEILGALAVVVGAIYGFYTHMELFGIKYSEVEIRPLASTKLYMLFLVENNGNKPASVGRVTGQFQFVGSNSFTKSFPLRLDVLEYEVGKTMIKPGDPQIMRVYFKNKRRLQALIKRRSKIGELKEAKCKFEFEIINYDGSQTKNKLDFDCRKYVAEYLRMRNISTITIPLKN